MSAPTDQFPRPRKADALLHTEQCRGLPFVRDTDDGWLALCTKGLCAFGVAEQPSRSAAHAAFMGRPVTPQSSALEAVCADADEVTDELGRIQDQIEWNPAAVDRDRIRRYLDLQVEQAVYARVLGHLLGSVQ